MASDDSRAFQITCKDCGYTRTFQPSDEEDPADVIIEHGRKRGHKLIAERVNQNEQESSWG